MLDGPVDALIRVAVAAGVGDAELLRHERIGRVEAVIRAPVHLHIDALRHVALDAAIARATLGMEAVFDWLDDRGFHDACFVATHAEHIVLRRENVFQRVRVVAIHATHAGVAHSAHLKRTMDKDLVEDLSVGIVKSGLVGEGEGEVVVVGVAESEGVGGQLVAAGVAGGAVLFRLLAVERSQPACIVAALRGDDVLFEPSVAFRAGEPLLDPSGSVQVVFIVEALFELRCVAVGAIGIPVHALPEPVTPFAREAIFAREDVDPAVVEHIIGRANRL